MNNILEYLSSLFPNPKCELNYHKDYELLIAVMLSAQTTDKRVNKVTNILFDKYQNLEELSKANINDIEPLIKELGNYKKKSRAIIEIASIIKSKYNGAVPAKRSFLESLPMVGRKTTNVVLSVIFGIPNIAVDTHVTRVSKRLALVKEPDDVEIIETKLKRKVPKEKWSTFHHQMVLFGRYYCLARNPKCEMCSLKNQCIYYKKRAKIF